MTDFEQRLREIVDKVLVDALFQGFYKGEGDVDATSVAKRTQLLNDTVVAILTLHRDGLVEELEALERNLPISDVGGSGLATVNNIEFIRSQIKVRLKALKEQPDGL